MSQLSAYLPQDRLRALAHGNELPEHSDGSVLFVEISGFNPLSESLKRKHGPQQGVKALACQMNAVYDALITEVERFGGSVISFAGDALTCWFEERLPNEAGVSSAALAVHAALALQAACSICPQVSIKVSVTSGTVRRIVVGDPEVQRIDVLAGAPVLRLAAAQQLARRGETLVDETTAQALGETLEIQEWRTAENGERFAVITHIHHELPAPPSVPSIPDPDPEQLKPWIIPPVFIRQQQGQGQFPTEQRPIVALFLRFTSLDYEGDARAAQKLDTLVSKVQTVLKRYDGSLLDLRLGDSASFIYAVFGAPLLHKDDARRALQAALALRTACAELNFLPPVQIGLSRGLMRCGLVGSSSRNTYSALGDEIDLGASLASTAAPGEILVSGRVQKEVYEWFNFELRPSLPNKSKAEPLPVFAVTGQRRQRAFRLDEPHDVLPLVGRQAELDQIEKKLEQALHGQGQVLAITGDAGVGKSRLLAEAIHLAHKKGFTGFGGACEAWGANTPFLVWKSIWQAFFGLDPQDSVRRRLHIVEAEIAYLTPERLAGLPVLSVLLDLPIQDTDDTRGLEPQARHHLLIALLEDCLKTAVAEGPLLMVLEDLQWLDGPSHDLLEALTRISASLPVCFLLAYRQPEIPRLQEERVERLPHYQRVALSPLSEAEARDLVQVKLARRFPEQMDTLPPEQLQALTQALYVQSTGNPFYLEELLNDLHDRGLNPLEAADHSLLDLPDSLHTLLQRRLQRLRPAQLTVLRSASIIGRRFHLAWLRSYSPTLGTLGQIKAELDATARLEITSLDTTDTELVYLFRHSLIQEAAYESLPPDTRARLHEQLARYIESLGQEHVTDLLAFHYSLSANTEKQSEYLRLAGDAAQKAYANHAAMIYYTQLLSLLPEAAEKSAIHLKCGRLLEQMGQPAEAQAHYQAALELEKLSHPNRQ